MEKKTDETGLFVAFDAAGKNEAKKGLKIPRYFTKEDSDPFAGVTYEKRSSIIRNPDGSIVFEMNDVEVPSFWSQVATDILAQKYFRKAGVPYIDEQGNKTYGSEKSIRQVAHRMAGCWRAWGERYGYFTSEADAQVFYDELVYMIINQVCVPNSPQWFNTGLAWAYGIKGPSQGHWYVDPETEEVKISDDAYTRPQPHACADYFTQVYSEEGTKFIGDIVQNNLVGLNVFDGERFVRILATKHNGKKEVFRISLKNGNYVDLTKDHLVLTAEKRKKDGGSYEWKEVDDLKPGMKLQQPSITEVKEKNAFSEDLAKARLAGWVVGDGSIGIYTGVMRMEIITVNGDEFDAVLTDVKEVFGESVSYWISTFETDNKKLEGKRIHLAGKKIHKFVEDYELLNKRSINATIPKRILHGVPQEKREFLKALFQADGCVRVRVDETRNSGDICLTTSSKELAFGVLQLLNSLGVYSRISLNKDHREDREDTNQIIIAYGSAREGYQEQIGFISTEKQQKLLLVNKIVARSKSLPLIREETIGSIEKIGIKDVYDIQTESGKFLGNGIVVHNCFIQKLSDDLVNPGGIFDLLTREARIFKYGSGTGSNFSSLRASGEHLSGGGRSSGLMSFLKIFDRAAGAIKSGGTTRRAAKMVCLDLDHPEIEEFIWWKVKEEEKVASLVTGSAILRSHLSKIVALASINADIKKNVDLARAVKEATKESIPLNYIVRAIDLAQQGEGNQLAIDLFDTHYESEAYITVSGQNSNNSVRIPNEFFYTLEKDGLWELKARMNGSVMKKIPARKLWDDIGYCAWASADPGVQYDTTMNEWHTCPEDGRINASNPCSEYLFLDDTACNLASINLRKFYDDEKGTFDVAGYVHTIRLYTMVLEISVLMAQFPSKEIALKSYKFRTLGLGYANLGSLLMRMGIPYDSDEGRAIGGALAAIMTGESYATSAAMAAALGPFPGYWKNRQHMMQVIRNHRRAAYDMPREGYEGLSISPVAIDQMICPKELLGAAHAAWDRALQLGEEYGYKNAQVTVIAPTGCLVGGSFISTERGLVRLRSLGNRKGNQWQEASFKVLTDEGPRQATNFYINGKAQTRRITTVAGYEIQGTPNHQIKIMTSEGAFEWKTLDEILPGDKIPLSMNTLFGSSQIVLLPPLPEMHWNADYETEVPAEMNPLLAELIGYFMGDGSLHSKGIRFCVTNGDDDVTQRITILVKELFHLDTRITPQEGYMEVAVHSVPLTIWWEAAGFAKLKPATHPGGKGYQPYIPDAVLYTNNKEVYAAFLRGLFEADGTVNGGSPAWTTASKEFSQEVKMMLLALGFPSTTKIDISGWGQSEIYCLRIRNASYNDKFRREIGFISSRKMSKIVLSTTFQGTKKDLVYIPMGIVQEVADAAGEYENAVLLSLQRHQAITRPVAEALYQRTQNPQLFHALQFFYDTIESNDDGGIESTYDLSVPENVTYIANGFISHNTIGLVMDCDTTGVEPDYALVKFKKLAGGGYFKIVNQSVPKALSKLGYTDERIHEIIAYCVGHGTLQGSPTITHEKLIAKGFSKEQLDAIEKQLPNVAELKYAFTRWVIGEEFLLRLGFSKEQLNDSSFDMLRALGFSGKDIERANEYVCGTMTIEGAPYLKEEHYAVFDCATKCGKKGQRFIPPYGHLKILSAVQPFISGSMSKTINMPRETTVAEIQEFYYYAWKTMCKCVALYRDGSKLSQPLNTTLQENPELQKLLESDTFAEEEYEAAAPVIGAEKQEAMQELESPIAAAVLAYGEGNGVTGGNGEVTENGGVSLMAVGNEGQIGSVKAAGYLGDEYACSGCGAKLVRRNGVCTICDVCGETGGCS